MVERLSRTLKQQLAKLIHQHGGEWDHYLPAVVLSFNSTPHSSTGYSPYFLAHGREPRVPANVSTPLISQTPQNYSTELVKRLDTVFQAVHSHHEYQSISVSTTLTNMSSSSLISLEIWYGWMIPPLRERNLNLTGLDLTKSSHQITMDLYTHSWIWHILKLHQKLFIMIDWSLIVPFGTHLKHQ